MTSPNTPMCRNGHVPYETIVGYEPNRPVFRLPTSWCEIATYICPECLACMTRMEIVTVREGIYVNNEGFLARCYGWAYDTEDENNRFVVYGDQRTRQLKLETEATFRETFQFTGRMPPPEDFERLGNSLTRHYKGGIYSVIGRALLSSDSSSVVVYQSMETGMIWYRPEEMFFGDVKLPDETVVKRFQSIGRLG